MKDMKMIAMAFGLSFWVGMGLTIGAVTMARLTGIALPQYVVVTEDAE